MHIKRFLFLIGFLVAFCGCNKADVGKKLPDNPGEGLTVSPAPTPEPTAVPTMPSEKDPVAKWMEPTPLPIFPPATATPAVLKMPERKVAAVDQSVDFLPITEEYFSDSVFCGFIRQNYDTDRDGFLSKEERLAVTELNIVLDVWEYSEEEQKRSRVFLYGGDEKTPVVLDGLDWFPNITRMCQEKYNASELEVHFDHHPGIKYISGGSTAGGTIRFYIDGCENLKTIYFEGEEAGWNLGLYVHDCKNLEALDVAECYDESGKYTLQWMYLSEVPKLKLDLNSYLAGEIWLDANAWVWGFTEYRLFVPNGIETDFVLAADGFPRWKAAWGTYVYVNWLGLEPGELHLKEQVEQMCAMNMENLPKESKDKDKLLHFIGTILFSPRKASIYVVNSAIPGSHEDLHEKDKDYKDYQRVLQRYYIVKEDGTITGYDTLEEVCAAAEKIEDLPDDLYEFFTEEKEE